MRRHAKAPASTTAARPGSTRGRRLLIGLTVALAILVLTAASALALVYHPFESETSGFSNPEQLAVDQSTGDLYVLNHGTNSIVRVTAAGAASNFSASATYISANELTGTSGGSFSFEGGSVENEIAVAPAGAPGSTAGDLYVTQSGGAVVVFAQSGEYLGRIEASSNPNSDSGGEACGVATDPAGNLYVGYYSGHVDKYVPTSNSPFAATFDSEITGLGGICNIAASSGALYAANWSSGPLKRYPLSLFPGSAGSADASSSGTTVKVNGSPVTSLAAFVDPTNNDLYVDEGDLNEGREGIVQLSSSGAFLGHSSNAALGGSRGVAVRGSSGLLYASIGSGKVLRFGPASPLPPEVGGVTPKHVGSTDAVLKATVNPEGEATTYRFEYGTDTSYGHLAPVPDASAGSGTEAVSVEAEATGLEPSTTYHFRLTATNPGGTVHSTDQAFHTFRAAVEEPDTCANASRRAEQHATYLPDCRAYEMVSPPNKNGGDVAFDTGRIRSAETESPGLPMALMFLSRSGFADVAGTGISIDYMAQRTLEPGTSGWSTHALTPPQEPLSIAGATNGQEPLYVGEAAPDLTTGVFRSFSPLTEEPNVARVRNLYLRADLRAAGAGHYSLLSPAFAPISPPSNLNSVSSPKLAGASADFSHVLFEARFRLTEDAPGSTAEPKLYESVNGTVRYVGQTPAAPATQCVGAACEPAPRAIPGQGADVRYTPHVISTNGSRVVFTVGENESATSGNLYLRDDHGTASTADDTTTQINVSDVTGEPGTQPASYWDASTGVDAEGNPVPLRVFFSTSDVLTADAANPGIEKLYMWSATPDGAGHHLTFISKDENSDDAPGEVRGTLGGSEDGSVVYFVQRGQDVAGEEPLGGNLGIYAWRQGRGLSYVGRLLAEADDGPEDIGGAAHTYGLTPELGARVTPNGLRLLISSRQPLRPGGFDHGGCPGDGGLLIEGKIGCRELYLYDLETGDPPACVSCSPAGVEPSSPAFYSERVGVQPSAAASHLNRPLGTDGSRIFFTTGESLVSADTNGRDDAYEWEAPGAGTCTEASEAFSGPNGGCIYLLSSGTDEADSYFLEATPDGHDVFIGTRQRLLGWDGDSAYDVYDARVQGGLPEPPAHAAACEGEACQPASGAAPAAASSTSSTFSGPANPKPKRPKHRGHRRKRHHRHRKHNRTAHANRRTNR